MGDDAELYTDMQEPWFWDWVEGSNDDYEDDYELELVYDRYFLLIMKMLIGKDSMEFQSLKRRIV